MSIKQLLPFVIIAYFLTGAFLYWFASKTIIDIFFRLLNFAVLLGIVIVFYQRKLGPRTKDLIHQKEQKQEVLKRRYNELIHDQNMLKQQLEDQDQFARYLIGKIEQWRLSFDAQQNQYKQERQKIHKAVEERTRHKAEWLIRDNLYKRAKVDTINQLHAQLTEQFEAPKQQQQFINKLLVFMRESL
ncbi:hypothetical protein E3J79_04485 [Candidatus Dependentiae bacterium]|nr:MAG: hypothetical protein E3J79_04485 [Candidatus Dependentiae bacterium]